MFPARSFPALEALELEGPAGGRLHILSHVDSTSLRNLSVDSTTSISRGTIKEILSTVSKRARQSIETFLINTREPELDDVTFAEDLDPLFQCRNLTTVMFRGPLYMDELSDSVSYKIVDAWPKLQKVQLPCGLGAKPPSSNSATALSLHAFSRLAHLEHLTILLNDLGVVDSVSPSNSSLRTLHLHLPLPVHIRHPQQAAEQLAKLFPRLQYQNFGLTTEETFILAHETLHEEFGGHLRQVLREVDA